MKKLLIDGLTILMFMFFTGCAGVPVKLAEKKVPLAEIYRKKAFEHEKSGDLQIALMSWKIVGSLNPENGEASERISSLKTKIKHKAEKHFQKGVQYYKKDSMKAARNQFLIALRYNPDHEKALNYLKINLTGKYYTLYKVKQADTLKSIAAKVYKDPEKDFLITYFNDLYNKAQLQHGTTLKLPIFNTKTPSQLIDTEKELTKARNLLKVKKYSGVLQIVEKILKYDLLNNEASDLANTSYYEWGKTLQRGKKYHESLKMFNNVNPGYKGIKEARSNLKKEMKDEAEVCYRRGVKNFVNERIKQAIQEWERTLALNPDHDKAKKDIDKAQSLLKKLEDT